MKVIGDGPQDTKKATSTKKMKLLSKKLLDVNGAEQGDLPAERTMKTALAPISAFTPYLINATHKPFINQEGLLTHSECPSLYLHT